jgi:hypothetical protein
MKRSRPTTDLNHLSPADRQALERAASILQKPVSELLGASQDARNDGRTSGGVPQTSGTEQLAFQPFLDSIPQKEDMYSVWKAGNSGIDDDCLSYPPAQPWNQFPQITHEGMPQNSPEFGLPTGTSRARYPLQGHDQPQILNYGPLENPELGHTGSWSYQASVDTPPWNGIQNNSSTQFDFQENLNVPTGFEILEANMRTVQQASTTVDAQDSTTETHPHSRESSDSTGQESTDFVLSASNSDENFPFFENDSWEEPKVQQNAAPEVQLSSSAGTTNSDWSLIELAQEDDRSKVSLRSSKSKADFAQWMVVDPGSQEIAERKPTRRGPFQDKQLQEETSETRKRKACVRCRMQKIRVRTEHSTPWNEH